MSAVRDLCGLLWAVAFLASILSAAMAFSIQRDRRAEQSTEKQFDKKFEETYDMMEKNPAFARNYPNWQDVHVEQFRAAISNAERKRWEDACRYWMLATSCALAAVVMLYVSK